MARKPFHQQLQENLEALKEGKEPPHKRAEEEARERFAALDDARKQDEIMNPAGVDVEFSFGKLRLHPFTMFDQSTAKGFCDGVLADIFGQGARNPVEAGYRLSSVILESATHKRKLLGLVAISSEKPGVIDTSEKGDVISRDLAMKFTSDDYLKAFNEIHERAKAKPKKA